MIVAEAGESTRWSRLAALTLSEAVAVAPASLPVTVCAPAVEAVQVAPLQDPFGVIEKVVEAVTSKELPELSKPCAV